MADPLPPYVLRNLIDKNYEKRKNTAQEIEGIVRALAAQDDHGRISCLIRRLAKDFCGNSQPYHRMGGVLGLAAVTVGLSPEASQHLERILTPVLEAFSATDSRVRYHACEALYNIAKVVRGDLIVYFNQIFDEICKLTSDSDPDVQSASSLLDRLLKDIVTESDEFSIEEFIPLLKERLDVLSPYIRLFLLGWITVLDNSPDFDMLRYLPEYLGGLFNMLSDSKHEVRHQADTALSEFLLEIQSSPSVDYVRMTEILVQRAGSSDDFTRQTAIIWINEFVKLGGEQLVPYYADILGAILPSISDKAEKIRVVSQETNKELLGIEADPSEGFNVKAVLTVAKSHLSSQWEATRIEALRWISALLNRHRENVLSFLGDFNESLLETLLDPSDKVVLLVLDVHACIAQDHVHFHNLVVNLVKKFKKDISLLEKRGALIICRFCVLLDAERVYRKLSLILEKEEELDFAYIMIQALNLILLTSSELSELRELLKQSLLEEDSRDLFESLYKSWCHSPMAIISLCLSAQAYEHASSVIHSLLEEDINAKFFVQIDKFIRLLETPVFTYLRLQLLEPERYISLLKVLYGLLMLLPQQSEAFKILRTRLKVVPYSLGRESTGNSSMKKISDESALDITNEIKLDAGVQPSSVDLASSMEQLEQMQKRYRERAKLEKQQRNNAAASSTCLKDKQVVEEGNEPPQARSPRRGKGQLHLG